MYFRTGQGNFGEVGGAFKELLNESVNGKEDENEI